MTRIKIYHQLGHNNVWNRDSFIKENIGDGLIIGARYLSKETVENLLPTVKKKSIFDPQFFIPGVPQGNLKTYPFFPATLAAPDEFSTTEFVASTGPAISADRCLDFQLEQNFEYITIPSRYYSDIPSDYTKRQEDQYVTSFLSKLRLKDMGGRALLQVVINENMIKSDTFMDELLNWITGIYDISGVYLILERNRNPKQLQDTSILRKILHLIEILKMNNFEVVIGYCNTEAILLSLVSPSVLTLGSYENLRMFDHQSFEEKKGKMSSPAARLYVPGLLQWINVNYIGAIKEVVGEEDFFSTNDHSLLFFQETEKWHFQNPSLYKHYFLEFTKQLNLINNLEGIDRYKCVSDMIKQAMLNYKRLSDAGIVLDPDSSGDHLAPWLTVANLVAKDRGWLR